MTFWFFAYTVLSGAFCKDESAIMIRLALCGDLVIELRCMYLYLARCLLSFTAYI